MNQVNQGSSLVDQQATLILPDGTEVNPSEPENLPTQFVEVPTDSEAVRIVIATRRSLADMPAPPKEMNAISAVVAYKMFGLSDPDIAIVTGLQTEQVERMQMLDAFDEMWNAAVKNIIEADTNDIEQLIHRTARNAVGRIALVNEQSTDPFAVIASSKDLLDRHERSRQRANENENNSLRIEIIRRDETDRNPEMEFE